MAEQRPRFPIRGVIALRPDGRGPVGFHNHVEFFTDRVSAAEYCDGAELVECVITDCRWRDRPTCAGWWMKSGVMTVQRIQDIHPSLDEWYTNNGPWFGPIPECPEESIFR